jgi:hypothetical protein
LGLDFNDILLMPKFYGSLIQANNSFKADGPGIVKSTLDRYKTLSREEIKIIEEITEESYQSVINLTCRM